MVDVKQSTQKPVLGTVRKIRGCKGSEGYYMISDVYDTGSKVRYSDGAVGWEDNDTILSDEPSDMTMLDFVRLELETV